MNKQELLSLGFAFLTVTLLIVWRESQIGSIIFWLSSMAAFGLIGWWWRK